MDENIIKKYWWVGLALVGVIFLAMRNSSTTGGATVTQIGSETDAASIAAIDAQTQMSNDQIRGQMFTDALTYQAGLKNLDAQKELATINANAQVKVAEFSANQALELAKLQANTEIANTQAQQNIANQAANLQAQQIAAQAAAAAAQTKAQNTSSWLGAISSGLSTFLPLVLNNNKSSSSILSTRPRIVGGFF